jgi:hypothetical protein
MILRISIEQNTVSFWKLTGVFSCAMSDKMIDLLVKDSIDSGFNVSFQTDQRMVLQNTRDPLYRGV